MTIDDRVAVSEARLQWPVGRPRVLLTDAWLANAGDALIALALDRMIRTLRPDASLLHAAYQWDVVGPRIPTLHCIPPLEDLLGTPWAPPAPGCSGHGDALVDTSDLVVCQGGGFLVEDYEPRARLAALAAVVRAGTPLALVGITLGRFDDPDMRADLTTILDGAALVVTRDQHSLEHARDAGAVAPVLGTDLALELFGQVPGQRRGEGVGVVLTDHRASLARRPARAALAHRVLRTALDAAPGEPIHVWSSVQGMAAHAREDDATLAATIVESLPRDQRARIHLHQGPMTPARAIELVRSTRALVTMRMHPALMAAGIGVPWALVLDDDRTSVFDGTSAHERVATSSAPDHVRAVIEHALSADAPLPSQVHGELAFLRDRLDVIRARLGALLDAPSARVRTTPLEHLRNTAQRAASALRYSGPGIVGALPTQAAGAVQGPRRTAVGPQTVWGWARVRHDEIASVLVTCDGNVVGPATLAPPAPDVATALAGHADQTAISWTSTVVFDQQHSVRTIGALVVTRDCRVLPATPLRIGIDARTVGRIVTPTAGATVAPGPLRVAGSALPDAPIAHVELAIDGISAGRARLFTHDVDFTFAHRALTGYEHVIDLPADAVGCPVTLTATIVTVDGERHRGGERVVRVRRVPSPTSSTHHMAERGAHRKHTSDRGQITTRRVAILTHELELGGAQLWLHEVVRYLRAEGVECLVVAGRDGPLRRELVALGVSVVITAGALARPDGGVDDEVRSALLAFDPNVALANTVETAQAVSTARQLGIPTVWAVHEHVAVDRVWNHGSGDGDGGTTEHFVALLRSATRVLFVCDATRDLYAPALGPEEALDVVPYGISVADLDRYAGSDPTLRRQHRAQLGLTSDQFLLVSVGTIEPRKAQALLTAALAAGGPALEHVHVALVGATGASYARSIERLAHELGVGARVHVIGATREPEGWLLAADAFVLPSDLESVPRSAMEAMAFGLPVLLGDVAGCGELLGFGNAGRVVSVRDVVALRSALTDLVAMTDAERAALGAAARARVVARHGDLSYAERIAALLEEAARARVGDVPPKRTSQFVDVSPLRSA